MACAESAGTLDLEPTLHCIEGAAREFFEDSVRDIYDALSVPDDGPWLQNSSLEPIRKRLEAKAADDGFELKLAIKPAKRVLSSREVAKKRGHGPQFQTFNKLFSKFAHPTAMAVFAPDEVNERLRDTFYKAGVAMADEARLLLDRELGAVAEAPSITQEGEADQSSLDIS